MRNKIKEYGDWLKTIDSGTTYSALWEEMKSTFNDEVHRGYGINTKRDYSALYKSIIFTNSIKEKVFSVLNILFNLNYAILSLTLGGSRKIYRKYGLHYATDIAHMIQKRLPDFAQFYKSYCKQHGEYYSYSGMRVLYYYHKALPLIPKEAHSALEIGAGMGNFLIIHARHSSEFNYIIIDIPEIIPAAYNNVKSHIGNTTELFLPNELEAYLASKAKRKTLWLLPSQMKCLEDGSFDFFCNTESFAEMPPAISQGYWDEVGRLLKPNSKAFLINRCSRFTGKDFFNYAEMSSPLKLTNDKLTCDRISIDEYRACIKKFRELPNLITVFTRNND